jgi:hypothetical protein
MARYHYETRRDAERKFPHRVDIPMPENGLGKQLNDISIGVVGASRNGRFTCDRRSG